MSKLEEYHRQIERLSNNPVELYTSWMDSIGIFGFIGAGCPTMYRSGLKIPITPLEIEISVDQRIPQGIYELEEIFNQATVKQRKELLQPFLEYRMRQDELNESSKGE